MAILVRGGNSSKLLPLQPIATYSHMLILVRGYFSKVLLLQPIAAHSYMANLVREGISSKVLPLQPVAAHSYVATLVGGNSSKVLPLQPNFYIILPPLKKIPAHTYIDKLPPPLLQQNGRILSSTSDPRLVTGLSSLFNKTMVYVSYATDLFETEVVQRWNPKFLSTYVR